MDVNSPDVEEGGQGWHMQGQLYVPPVLHVLGHDCHHDHPCSKSTSASLPPSLQLTPSPDHLEGGGRHSPPLRPHQLQHQGVGGHLTVLHTMQGPAHSPAAQ